MPRMPASPTCAPPTAYRATMTAIAAMMPECMLQNIAQPHRKPAAGENIWRRNTYTPPVCGYADDSSAQMLAPNQVGAPATIHTTSMPPKVGAARLTSDGWTKIDAPTMVPTTMAVACGRPMERRSAARMPLHETRLAGGIQGGRRSGFAERAAHAAEERRDRE